MPLALKQPLLNIYLLDLTLWIALGGVIVRDSVKHIYKSSSILNIRIKDCVFDSSRLDLTYSAWSSINLIRLFGFQENPNRGAQQVFGAHETRKAYDLFLVNVEPIVNMKQELFPDTSLSEVMTFWPPLLPPDEAGFFLSLCFLGVLAFFLIFLIPWVFWRFGFLGLLASSWSPSWIPTPF